MASRIPAPEWAVWSLMAALWCAHGCPGQAEGAMANLLGAVVDAWMREQPGRRASA